MLLYDTLVITISNNTIQYKLGTETPPGTSQQANFEAHGRLMLKANIFCNCTIPIPNLYKTCLYRLYSIVQPPISYARVALRSSAVVVRGRRWSEVKPVDVIEITPASRNVTRALSHASCCLI